jgi:putative oxidoreductase
MPIETTIKRTREKLLALTEKLWFLAPALIRLTLGVVFIQSGWGKLHTLDKITEYFESLNIPMPGLNARVAAGTEFFGGILLLVGLGTRLVSLPMAFVMVVALLTAKREEITSLPSLLGVGVEWDYLVMFLVIVIIGPGVLSLDALIVRRFGRTGTPVLPKPLLRPGAPSAIDG